MKGVSHTIPKSKTEKKKKKKKIFFHSPPYNMKKSHKSADSIFGWRMLFLLSTLCICQSDLFLCCWEIVCVSPVELKSSISRAEVLCAGEVKPSGSAENRRPRKNGCNEIIDQGSGEQKAPVCLGGRVCCAADLQPNMLLESHCS